MIVIVVFIAIILIIYNNQNFVSASVQVQRYIVHTVTVGVSGSGQHGGFDALDPKQLSWVYSQYDLTHVTHGPAVTVFTVPGPG